ncbi:hypothetical protein WN55_10787 [Dufourea novaeangliae]|uniref:Uncharacterized protein n=1 Tax=Dufourea novaeangliae TaxID=178035 RepID=A0A154PBI7_DUFNO|nr:hypothetical protein WN55_10787 [Dufourea novaeangliae]
MGEAGKGYLGGLGPLDSDSGMTQRKILAVKKPVYVNKSGSKLPIDFQSCFRVSFAKAPLGRRVHSNVDLSLDLFYLEMYIASVRRPILPQPLPPPSSLFRECRALRRATCPTRIFRVTECEVLT